LKVLADFAAYSRSHGQQGGGEPESFPRADLSSLIFVLSLLANTIIYLLCSIAHSITDLNHG
jgi:hypothetical protein